MKTHDIKKQWDKGGSKLKPNQIWVEAEEVKLKLKGNSEYVAEA